MNDEWNWNQPTPEDPNRQERTVPEDRNRQDHTVPEEPEPGGRQEAAAEEVPETYHWVNPRMRQEGMGTDANTYENTAYREPVDGSEPAFQTGQTDRTAQDAGSNYEIPATGRRQYGTYPLNREDSGEKREKKPMGTGKKFLVTMGMAVVFGVVAGGIFLGIQAVGQKALGWNQDPIVPLETTKTAGQDSGDSVLDASGSQGSFTVAQVAENAMPSVVSITNASVEIVRDFFGGTQEYPIESAGSGIIVGENEEELLIATNNHVVEGAETLTVSFQDASSYEAQIKGNDTDNDLAVISVRRKDLSQETLNAIKIVSLGDSDALVIGEQVVAIGNALGYGQSVTSGWVSALHRDITDENGKVSHDLIQTDAAINPGNSGGALLNLNGELIGINVAKTSGSSVEGMGYAIPISVAQPVLDGLMSRETRFKVDDNRAAYMGVVCLAVDSTVSQMYGIPEGAFVDSVEEGGPAEAAGIQKNDVICQFDGVKVEGSQELVELLEYYEAGETVDVVIARSENGTYQERTVSVTLGRRSEMKQEDPSQNS